VRPPPAPAPRSGWAAFSRPEQLREGCEHDLRELKRDVLDLVHFRYIEARGTVPFLESLDAMSELKREGKIRHLALSNINVAQLTAALAKTPIVAVQNRFNVGGGTGKLARMAHVDTPRECEVVTAMGAGHDGRRHGVMDVRSSFAGPERLAAPCRQVRAARLSRCAALPAPSGRAHARRTQPRSQMWPASLSKRGLHACAMATFVAVPATESRQSPKASTMTAASRLGSRVYASLARTSAAAARNDGTMRVGGRRRWRHRGLVSSSSFAR
jgi:hypothetical protein